MHRKPSRAVPGLLVALLPLLGLGCRAGEPPPVFRNVFLIVIDTLRSDHLPSYGYQRATAPFLAELAAEGIQVQGYSASSWTRSSVATLLTGLHPQRHQAISRSDSLPEAVPYLPELLTARGWSAAGYVGNRNVGTSFGFARGFDAFYQHGPPRKVDAKVVTDRCLSLADSLAAPYFFYAHYVDPHDPYRPRRIWEDPEVADLPPVQPRHFRRPGAGSPTPAQLRRMIAQYDGEIRGMDLQIRRLLAGFAQRGLLQDTLVVITADHGEEFGEHGGLAHGATLFEEVLKVPFILWSESPPLPHRRSDESFHQVDFLPSMLEALGLEVPELGRPEALDGTSRWRQLVADGVEQTRDLYFHLDLDGRGALATLAGSLKLIHRNRDPFTEVFDLREDAAEQRPLELPATELLATLLRHHNRLGILAARREQHALDDETRRSLAALGYLQLDTTDAELASRAVPRKLDRERGLAAREDRSPAASP